MKRDLPKTLKDNENTYRNGVGNMCGGVISKTRMFKNIQGNMMAYYMEDDKFEEYKQITDTKKQHEFFKKYAQSVI